MRYVIFRLDGRQDYLAELMKDEGEAYELINSGTYLSSPEGKQQTCWILPIPSFYYDEEILIRGTDLSLQKLVYHMGAQDMLVYYADGAAEERAGELLKYTHTWNLCKDSEYVRANALLTAEAALAEAIEHNNKTLMNHNCLVLGYGRIGKALVRRLDCLGAFVTATARRDADLQRISANGIQAMGTGIAVEHLDEYDFIFNTIPARIITEQNIAAMREDAVFLELASAPYGLDHDKAKELGRNIHVLPSLPGKVYPHSAAETIWKAILAFQRYEDSQRGEYHGRFGW